MKMSFKPFHYLAILAFVICPRSAFCQTDELQPFIHEMVMHYSYAKGKNWEADKMTLGGYDQDQVVRALISEVDNQSTPLDKLGHLVIVVRIFRDLELPPDVVCQELDNEQSPERKRLLMRFLRGAKSPEVIQALLCQLSDKRLLVEPEGHTEIAKGRPLRVCDIAFNTLADFYNVQDSQLAGRFIGYARRDEIIQETLAELKLAIPK
jgi:hypothetical protein